MSLVALLVVGVIAQQRIPVQLLPAGFAPPFLWVEIPTLPGAPADHERAIAEPVEDAFATLPGLSRMRTFVRSDAVELLLELEARADVPAAHDQVRDRLDRTAPLLPDGVRGSFIWRHDPNDEPVFILGITWPGDARDPYETLTDRLARPLERVPGVSRSAVRGLQQRKLRVQVHEARARALGVDPGTLVERLRRDNFALAAGALEEDGRRVLVRAVARHDDLPALRALPIAPGVTLSDLADVRFAPDEDPTIHRIDGQPAATLMVFKESGANTIAVCTEVAERVARRLAEDPALAGFKLHPFFDQGRHIEESIDDLKRAAVLGGAIAVVILFLFLHSAGMTLLVALSIPLCLLTTVTILFFTGDSLNMMSMMGLMLSVGMVVDNAIVVSENVARLRAAGVPPVQASVEGAAEVSLAITLATLTTMVVFLPLILLNDSPGLSFYLGKVGFPVCWALSVSLGVALLYIPAGARRLGPEAAVRSGFIFGHLQRGYAGLLAGVLRHRRGAALVILALLASSALPLGKIRRVDRIDANLDQVNVHLHGPPNGSPEELDETARELEARILANLDRLEARSVLARDGWSREHVMVQVFFKPPAQRKLDRETAIARLNPLLPERPGYRLRVGWGGGGAGQEGGVSLKVVGPDTTIATEIAKELTESLRRMPGVDGAALAEAEAGAELRFRVVREAAERAGLTPLAIGGALDYTLRGRPLEFFHTASREVPMVVELTPADRSDLDQVTQLALRGTGEGGAEAELGLVTRTERSPGYGRIGRENRRAAVELRVTGPEDRLFDVLEAGLAGVRLPAGYAIDLGDRFRSRGENESGGGYAVVVAIFLVFFLMGVLFESLVLPFSILLTIPLAFAGVFWTLWITDTPLDLMAIIGCIILVGVVVNNGIVLIDQVQQRRRDGQPRDEALVEAAARRVRPILMTALTTIAGLIPMALGKAALLGIAYHPLGRVVIGGPITGTLLTLVAVPLFYSLLDDLRGLPGRARLLGRRPPVVPRPAE